MLKVAQISIILHRYTIKYSSMKNFFVSFFASLLAFFVFCLIGFFLLIGIAATFSSEEPKVVASNSVLVLDLSNEFLEQVQNDPISEIVNKRNGKSPSLS